MLSAFLFTLIATALSSNFAHADDAKITSEKIDFFSIATSNNTIGKLTFVGGLELASPLENFGGLSGLRLNQDGTRLFSVSDHGFWLTGEIERNAAGQMTAVTDAKLTCLCKRNGNPYPSKHWADAEALEIRGNRAFVAFERLNRINGYTLDDNFTPGPPAQETASFKPHGIAYNTGLEALALAPDTSAHAGRFIAISEDSPNQEGNHRAFIADAKAIDEFAITRRDDYSITDAVFLPAGDLLILERRFGLSVGLGIRIRRIDGSSIQPGQSLSGEIIMEAGLTSRIDNMEGIATWQTPSGETRIVLISDDNYNRRVQRTLLLEFVLGDR